MCRKLFFPILLVLVLHLAAETTAADWKRINIGVGSAPRYLFDVDDDGHVDSISTAYWYKNPGDGIGSWTSYSIGNDDYPGSGCARTGDIDGDGLPDLVIGVGRNWPAPDRNRIYAFINPGNTEIWKRYYIGTLPDAEDGVETVAIGDMDKDGYPDILAGGECTELRWYINPGDMNDTWDCKTVYDFSVDVEGMVIKDFDNDGYQDIAVTTCAPLGLSGGTYVLTNPQTRTGNWARTTLDAGRYSCVETIAAGDIDGDGWDDVILANRRPFVDSYLYWYENPQGPGSWTRRTIDTLSTDHLNGYAPEIADIDWDGNPDVICYHYDDGVTYWYENNGTGTSWTKHRIYGASMMKYAVGDVDNDYDWDIICGRYWYINPTRLIAWNPDPVGVSVPNDVVLSWSPGEGAESHNVYFATDYNDVANAGLSSKPAGDVDSNGQVNFADVLVLVEQWLDNPEGLEPSANLNDDDIVNLIDFAIMADDWMGCGVFRGNQDTNTYDTNRCDPCGLELDVTYYWRIDEVRGASTLKGKVWEFTTRSDPNIYLVAHYDFETGSGTTVYDRAANPADGTLNGDPQWVAGKIGDWALDFDGTDDYVKYGSVAKFDITDAITFALWVKVRNWTKWTTIAGRYHPWFIRKGQSGNLHSANWRTDGTSGGGTAGMSFAGTTSIDDGDWHHVSGTYDGATGKQYIYIDGILENFAQGDVGGQINHADPRNFAIAAAIMGAPVQFLDGQIDEVRIYSRALLKEEIEKLARQGND